MLNLLSKIRKQGRPQTQSGERIYAIGDIHGRFDLLQQLLSKIENHNAALQPAARTHVVILGDLVDRGPQSAQVLEYLREIQANNPDIIVLMGNHEDLMLRALARQPGMLRAWMRVGGDRTLESFGLEIPDRNDLPPQFHDMIDRAIPADLIKWIEKLPISARSGDYFFCHAGLRPGVPLKRQSRSDMLWIRDEFLKDQRHHGVVVVHGHSVEANVEIRDNRIGIDSGAYCHGKLTAIYLEGTKGELLYAQDDSSVDTLGDSSAPNVANPWPDAVGPA